VLIPKEIRDRLGLRAGVHLHLTMEEDRLVLERDAAAPRIEEETGILVVLGTGSEIPDHRSIREQELDRSTPS